MERAEKMMERLTKAVYADDEVTVSLMMYVAAKFTASILLTIQEEAYNFHVEDEFLDVVKGLMKVMGKDLRIQKLKNEREEIDVLNKKMSRLDTQIKNRVDKYNKLRGGK